LIAVVGSVAEGFGYRWLHILLTQAGGLAASTAHGSEPKSGRWTSCMTPPRGRAIRVLSIEGECTEFTSRHFLVWCIERQIELAHIQPAKPQQNGYVESFNGKLRDECLYVSWFENLWDARRKIMKAP
jgi:putative transposase